VIASVEQATGTPDEDVPLQLLVWHVVETHVMDVPPQAPLPSHTSLYVQAFPSLQAVPAPFGRQSQELSACMQITNSHGLQGGASPEQAAEVLRGASKNTVQHAIATRQAMAPSPLMDSEKRSSCLKASLWTGAVEIVDRQSSNRQA
jgi:hypothetical protein